MGRVRVLSVVGARPQFVKIAPVSREFRSRRAAGTADVEDFIVHTGQHYDAGMSDVFFSELDIPAPAANLGVGSASHGAQTGRILEGLESLLLERRPDVVVVYGDTNSTIAGALAASKLHLPVVHVEAGLRSFNRRMPEEINRIATDHLSDCLLAPTATAMANLVREGLGARASLTGDVMYDAVLFNVGVARERSTVRTRLGLAPGAYGVVTVHRAENTEPQPLQRLLARLEVAAKRWKPLVFPMHPRTREAIRKTLPSWSPPDSLRLVEPLGYLDTLALVGDSAWVLTDSGGLQKEALFLGRPCVTLRRETEWTETVSGGANLLAGAEGARLEPCLEHWDTVDEVELGAALAATARGFGDGHAARAIVDAVLVAARTVR